MNRIRKQLATATLAGLLAGAGAFAFALHPAGASVGAEPAASAAANATSVTNGAPTNRGASVAATEEAAVASVLQHVIHRPGQQVAGTDTGQWASMKEFMTWVEQDVASVWNWYYRQWGYTFTSDARLVFPAPGEGVATACGDVTDDRTMEYCSLDDSVYFSQALATSLWNGSYVGPDGQRFTRPGGDFAVATMLAHEYGHNVEAELGVLAKGYPVPKTEQMADCLSGAFARVAYFQNVLDPNDVNEAVTTAFMVGDSNFSNPLHHGTSAERMAVWKLGYNSASPAACWSILG